MRLCKLLCLTLTALPLLSGCQHTETIRVGDTVTVRLAETVRAKVYLPDGKGGWDEQQGAKQIDLVKGGYFRATLHLPATQPTK